MKLSLIIPLYYNDLELYQIIMRCLKSIPLDSELLELIIVDDASPLDVDDFKEYLNGAPGIWLTNEKNLGYTNTVNRGLLTSTGDVLVIMNDDITLKVGQLDRFLTIHNQPGIFSPKTNDEGRGDKFGAIWGMNRATFEIMEPLCPTLPHFFSDAAYYDRAKELRVPIVKWKDMVVEHVGGATYKHINKEELYAKDHENYRNLD